MKRLCLLMLAAACWLGPASHESLANPDPEGTPRLVRLAEQLEYMLLVRTEEERIFLSKVIKAVRDGDLKDEMVLAVARKARTYNARLPFPYFQVMMEKLATRKGVVLGA